ncbi:MAG: SprB repeat-containing protein [Bacteroidetes bacterium]|nr:SprB repeat-containing protein [Bacteroidota bacterium]
MNVFRKSSLILLFAFYPIASSLAQNLVPNPSFENLATCPDNFSIGFDQLTRAPAWHTATKGTPDLLNSCALPAQYVDVPVNYGGSQLARTGNGYSGLFVYDGNSPQYREYLETPLTNTLKAGQIYEIVLWVSLADSAYWAGNELQAYFSGSNIYVNNFLPLSPAYQPQVTLKGSGFLTDETNWVKISGLYCAKGFEKHIIIGNFKNDATTSLLARPVPVPPPPGLPFGPNKCYYFIDDISVAEYAGPNPLTITSSNTNAACGSSTGSATVSASGAPGIFTYSWSTGATGQTISGLSAGIYTVVVNDTSGCFTNSFIVPINDVGGPSVSTNVLTNAACYNSANGAININVSGGSPAYTFSWTTGATSEDVSGLLPGQYGVVVRDAAGCIGSYTAAINASSFFINSYELPNCSSSNSNGSATVSITGGSSPFLYTWSPSTATGATATGLSPGNYSITVTDSNGCSRTDAAIVSPSGRVDGSITISGCGTFAKVVTAVGTGGNGNYFYNWTGPPASVFNNSAIYFANGTYSVIITDLTCSTTIAFTLPASGPTLTINTTNISCFGANNGTATASIAGGLAPYTYSWSTGASATTTITNLTASTYTATITDKNSCIAIQTGTVTQPSTITANTIPIAAACGVSNGSASVSASGGTGSFSYTWSNNATGQTSTGLAAGTYTATVSDANNCTVTTTATITNTSGGTASASVQSNVSCNPANDGGTGSGNDGSASASIAGGTPDYTYSWSNAATGQTIGGLIQGTYTVSVTDGNSCVSTSAVVITQPPPITAITNTVSATCGASNGSASVSVGGGTGSFTYNWSAPGGATGQTATGLAAGNYTVTVTDANNCTTTAIADIVSAPPLIGQFTKGTANCAGCGCKEWIMVTGSGGISPYTYSWPDGYAKRYKNHLCPGTYTINITDKNGCSINVSLTTP